ncbi:MAG: transglutaminase TgpA family protein [Cognaticolwellia sp.]
MLISAKNKKKRQSSHADRLKLNPNTYYALLVFQGLNLSSLVQQFHIVYLLFAILALIVQFVVHYNYTKQGATNSKAKKTLATKRSAIFYPSPVILPSWLILILAILGCVAIALAGRELGLLLSMMHLLCFAYSLKMFEIPRRKDLYQLVVLGIFVATSSLIFIQSIYFSLAIIVLVFGNFLTLLKVFNPISSLSSQAKLLSKLSLYAIPFAVVLFIGFPKLSPFWQVPNVKSAKVGLSDSVKIGDIAQLALSDELAFRVSFKNQTPAHAQLYWRAMVLDDFDGVTWRQSKKSHRQKSTVQYRSATLENAKTLSSVDMRGSAINYQVIVEPSYQSWLFALDFATSEQSRIGQRSDFALFYRGIISQTLSYQVSSYPDAVLSPVLTEQARAMNLALTGDNNPRLLAKGMELRQQYVDDKALINHVLEDFNQEDYYYTLQPPGLKNNSLDQFYFDTRAGFCEHYASTFAYLMRASGIPARMVVGYLGGELNPKGNYLTVYQRNAHAWAEVWLPGSGWQRVDPTSAVDPERVESGFSTSLMQEYADLSSSFFSIRTLQAMQWFNQLKLQIDALDYQWTRWVIGYGEKQQSRFLAQLLSQLKNAKTLFYFIAIVLMITVLRYFWLSSISRTKKNHHQVKALYLKSLQLLAKHKLEKTTSMTPRQFAKFIAETRPDLFEHFEVISAGFEQAEYQQGGYRQGDNENSFLVGNSSADNRAADKSSAEQTHFTTMKRHYRHLYWQLWFAKLSRA